MSDPAVADLVYFQQSNFPKSLSTDLFSKQTGGEHSTCRQNKRLHLSLSNSAVHHQQEGMHVGTLAHDEVCFLQPRKKDCFSLESTDTSS